ncbi:MAG: hypothetical protein KGL39_12225 [Patescibacteria group bacterium]|nr:hypothetical protein [Patescibacteria group bacterium]
MHTDWMWCYENPKEAAAEIDRLRSIIKRISVDMGEGNKFGRAIDLLPKETMKMIQQETA